VDSDIDADETVYEDHTNIVRVLQNNPRNSVERLVVNEKGRPEWSAVLDGTDKLDRDKPGKSLLFHQVSVGEENCVCNAGYNICMSIRMNVSVCLCVCVSVCLCVCVSVCLCLFLYSHARALKLAFNKKGGVLLKE
jgi:hypothetical protein